MISETLVDERARALLPVIEVEGVTMECQCGEWALSVPLTVDLEAMKLQLLDHRGECVIFAASAAAAGAV